MSIHITARRVRRSPLNARNRATPVTECHVQWKTDDLYWNLGPHQRETLENWCVRHIGTFWDDWASNGQYFLFADATAALQFTLRWRGATSDDLLQESREGGPG